MKHLFISLAAASFIVLAFSASANAQDCPKISVFGPSENVKAGDSITFSVNSNGGDPKVEPTYSWSVSASTIASGQGTVSITVDTASIGGESITATVEVGGYPEACSSTSSWTATVEAKPVAIKIGEYAGTNKEEEWARLDVLTIEMSTDPTASAYIIIYRGSQGKATDYSLLSKRIRGYLVDKRGIDPSTLVFMDGGKRETQAIELWLTPNGAEPPQPSKTIK